MSVQWEFAPKPVTFVIQKLYFLSLISFLIFIHVWYKQSLLIISSITRRAATWPLILELITCACLRLLKCVLRDHSSNNCTHSGNVCCCTYMVNNDYDKFRSFSRLDMTLFRHRTCTYLHGRADRFLVSVFNGLITNRLWYKCKSQSSENCISCLISFLIFVHVWYKCK